MRRRLRAVLAGAVVLAAAAAAVAIADPFASTASANGVADNAYPTSLYTVARQDLSDQTQVSATLGYAGSYSVVNHAQGTVTSLPSVGQVVTQGHVLYRVNGQCADRIHRLVPVSLGLFDDADGLVQVTGSGLAVGQRVVVPAL
jgi:hypothetical protein